jgi:GT2 family glycosyltransferase
MPDQLDATKIFRLALEEPLRPLEVEPRYCDVLLVVSWRGGVIGEIRLPALSVIPVDVIASTIAVAVGERIWRREIEDSLLAATREAVADEASPARVPTASVVVCTRDRADILQACLTSLLELETDPLEIIVVDNAPSDDRTRALCAELPVSYVLEPQPGASRARNRGVLEARGELVAFTDDDCVVDSRWLDDLGKSFSDNLVMAASGYIGPLELESRAQYLFELHGGFEKRFEKRMLDGTSGSPVVLSGLGGASANLVVRRRAFELVGLFAEDFGPGTPARGAEDAYLHYRLLAAGYRIAIDPSRIVWHRHRTDEAGVRQVLSDYSLSAFAYTTRCLVAHRELGVIHVWGWWIRHLLHDLNATLRGRDRAMPLRVVLGEIGGVVRGPWRQARSAWSRRKIPPLVLPSPAEQPPSPRIEVTADHPSLSVVLPSLNRREKLAEVLTGLDRQNFPPEQFETVVVLDGSTDGSSEMVRSRTTGFELRLIEQENRGLASARNRGASEATKAVVVFIDDDTIPDPDWLTVHARAHRDATADHLALGYYPPVVEDGTLWGHVVRSWWEDHFRRKAEPDHRWTYIDFAGGNASFPAPLFQSFGGFDEAFRGRREDWELAVRLLDAGVRFAYYPDAKALHYLDTNFATALRHERQQAGDDVLIATKHPQMKSQLPLAGYVHWFPEASESLARTGPVRAATLERLRFRGRWRRLVDRLLTNSYALGLEDAFPSREGFLGFMASTWEEPVDVARVALDGSLPVELPAGTTPVELAAEYGGTSLGRLHPVEPGHQWEWEAVAQRVGSSLGDSIRRVVLSDRLAAHDEPKLVEPVTPKAAER